MKKKTNQIEIRDMVLQKAAELIATRGPKRWSTAELAKVCGLAKNTLYKIIGSKEQLVETIVMDQIELSNGIVSSIILNAASFKEAMHGMVREGPHFLTARPRVALPEIFIEYPALAPKAMARQQEAAEAILDFGRKAQAEGLIRQDMEPEFIYDLVRGILEHYTRTGLKGQALTDALIKAFTCLFEGLRDGDWSD